MRQRSEFRHRYIETDKIMSDLIDIFIFTCLITSNSLMATQLGVSQ